MVCSYREEDLEKTSKLFSEGKSLLEISKVLGVAKITVIRRLTHLGVYEDRRTKDGEFSDWRRTRALDESFFEEINTEAKAYILGFIAADGNVTSNVRVLQIALAAKDKDHLERLRDLMGSTHPLIHRKSNDSYSVHMGSKRLCTRLQQLGVVPKKSLILTDLPYLSVPDDLKRHFLRGYFDGDGYVCFNWSGKIGYTRSGSVFDVVGTEAFLKSFDSYFPNTTSYFKKLKDKETWVWRVTHRENISKVLDELYRDATIFISRKRDRYTQFCMECAHVKPSELSGNPNGNAEGNQQPSNSKESAGSETIETTV